MKKFYHEHEPDEFHKVIIQESDEAKPLGLIFDLYDTREKEIRLINSYTVWYEDLNI